MSKMLYEEGAGEEDRGDAAEAGGDGNERVADRVAKDGGAEAEALGDGGADEVGGEVVEQVVLHQHRQEGEAADHVADQGQDGVHEDVLRLFREGQVFEVVADEAAGREPLERRVGEADEQDESEGEARNGVAEKDDDRGPGVEVGAMAQGLDHAERHADGVHEKKRDQTVVGRDGQALEDEVHDRLVVAGGDAEVPSADAAQPLHVGDGEGLVEAELGLDLVDLLLRQRLALAVAALHADLAGLGEHAFHRTAGQDAGEEKDDQRRAEQGRENQQESADKILPHAMEERGGGNG